MKRIGGLFDAIAARENLAAAAWRAAGGKRARPEVRRFFAAFDGSLRDMHARLSSGSWTFAPYTCFRVRDTKTRTIHAPAFRDRVAHHALIRVVGPIFEKGAIQHSYACRTGRGQHAALVAARRWTRRGWWYGKVDVEKFYDSVDHATLRRLLARRFREARLLRLFDALLDSYSTAPGKGLPIGALTSQYLGNFYLDAVDRQVKATGLAPSYLRYMDDIVMWGERRALATLRGVIAEALAALGLRARHGGEWNRCEQGVPLLGFIVYPGRVRVGREGRKRLRRKLRALERQSQKGTLDERGVQDRGTSLFAHVTTADDSAWRRTVLSFSRLRNDGRDALEPPARGARRLLEQRRQEVPRRVSQQEEARQRERQPGLPGLCGSWHDDLEQALGSPDDARSCSAPHGGSDESPGQSSAGVEIQRGAEADARDGEHVRRGTT